MPFSPLGKGFLTGTVDADTEFTEGDIRTGIPRFSAEARAADQAVVDLIRRIATIPGTRRLERLDENLASVDLALGADDVAELDQASAAIDIRGERYPEQLQAMIDR